MACSGCGKKRGKKPLSKSFSSTDTINITSVAGVSRTTVLKQINMYNTAIKYRSDIKFNIVVDDNGPMTEGEIRSLLNG